MTWAVFIRRQLFSLLVVRAQFMMTAVTYFDVWRLLLSPGLSEAVPPGTERGGSEDESRPRNTLEKSYF